MISTLATVHEQFASFFPDKALQPWAWYLSKRLAEGHICVPVDDGSIYHSGHPFDIKPDVNSLRACTRYVSTDPEIVRPFILYKDKLYLHRYFTYETQIVEQLRKRMENSRSKREAYMDELIRIKPLVESLVATLPDKDLQPDQKPDWQLISVINTLLNDFSIITGGPGTGKTTTLAKLLRLLYTATPGCRVALAAPTGKASMRMLESLRERTKDYPDDITKEISNLKPYTLHRLLGYKRNSIYFKHNGEQPLPFDWVIVDEASMIDVPMFAKLLAACKPETRLLLLGDKDQLASVEAGSLLGDLCISAGALNHYTKADITWMNDFIPVEERKIPDLFSTTAVPALANCITELRYSHRFNQQGEIGQLSLAVIRGDSAAANDVLAAGPADKVCLTDHTDEKSFAAFVEEYAAFMQETDIAAALAQFNKLRVLVTVREGSSGLYAMNRKIEQLLHAAFPQLVRPDNGFYHNRPVIVTRNNYELNLFNGDIGIVRKDPATNKVYVWFDAAEKGGSPRPFNPVHLTDCETVFAMTIHKSQGSEFDRVLVVLPDNVDNPLLTRELLYTGITRAKNAVMVRGTEAGLAAGISRQVERISGIKTRLH